MQLNTTPHSFLQHGLAALQFYWQYVMIKVLTFDKQICRRSDCEKIAKAVLEGAVIWKRRLRLRWNFHFSAESFGKNVAIRKIRRSKVRGMGYVPSPGD